MAFAVSLVMEFKSPVGNMDLYDKVRIVLQGLGLAFPARTAVEHVGPNTISIAKMICDAPVFNKLTKLLRPEDAITQELLARYEMFNGLFMLSKEPYSAKRKATSISNIANPPLASVEPQISSSIEPKLEINSNDAGVDTATSSSSIPHQGKEPHVSVNKRSTPDETGQSDHPSKRLKTTHNLEDEVDSLHSSLLEKVAELEAAKEGETGRSLQEKNSEHVAALANEEQETNSVTQIEGSRRESLPGIVFEIQAKLLSKEKELKHSVTQGLNAQKIRNQSLLKELNEKNVKLRISENTERTANEKIADLQQKLDLERGLRLKAEKLLDDIRRELKFPFIVPSLLDAFIVLSESNVQLAPATSSTDVEEGQLTTRQASNARD